MSGASGFDMFGTGLQTEDVVAVKLRAQLGDSNLLRFALLADITLYPTGLPPLNKIGADTDPMSDTMGWALGVGIIFCCGGGQNWILAQEVLTPS